MPPYQEQETHYLSHGLFLMQKKKGVYQSRFHQLISNSHKALEDKDRRWSVQELVLDYLIFRIVERFEKGYHRFHQGNYTPPPMDAKSRSLCAI